jgi:hypothetical protein
VATKGESAVFLAVRIQAAPPAHTRAAAIGADDPACSDDAPCRRMTFGQENLTIAQSYHRRVPKEGDAQGCGALDHAPVQHWTAHADADGKFLTWNRGEGKAGFGFGAVVDKSDAAQGKTILWSKLDAQLAQRGASIGH